MNTRRTPARREERVKANERIPRCGETFLIVEQEDVDEAVQPTEPQIPQMP